MTAFDSTHGFLTKLMLMVLVSISLFSTPSYARLTDTIEDETVLEGEEPIPPPLAPEQQEELAQIKDPVLSDGEIQEILRQYRHVDPKGMIPRILLNKALVYFHANKQYLANQTYLTVINFSYPSSRRRMFIITMATGAVLALHMAHGTGSDPNSTGTATLFSNVPGSNRSSLGFYRTAETYFGKHGYSLRLDGLSDTNSNARPRAIVLHGATYVRDTNIKQGRSWGCPAVSNTQRTKVVESVKEGSLIYAGLSRKNLNIIEE